MKKNRKYIMIVCESCGKEKSVRADSAKIQKFCSRDCASEHMKENIKTGKEHPNYKRLEVACANCAKALMRLPAEIEGRSYLYCDMDCMQEHRKKAGLWAKENHPRWKGDDTYNCIECGKAVTVKGYLAKRQKFCSPNCVGTYNAKHGLNGGIFNKGQEAYNKGKTHEELYDKETADRLRLVSSENAKKYMAGCNKGRKQSLEQRIKNSCRRRGISVDDFDKFISPERNLIMGSQEYISWRGSVFERDDYTCNHCDTRGCELHAHHIESYAKNKDKRFDVENGITLCKECHEEFHRIYSKLKFTANDYHEWIKLEEAIA